MKPTLMTAEAVAERKTIQGRPAAMLAASKCEENVAGIPIKASRSKADVPRVVPSGKSSRSKMIATEIATDRDNGTNFHRTLRCINGSERLNLIRPSAIPSAEMTVSKGRSAFMASAGATIEAGNAFVA